MKRLVLAVLCAVTLCLCSCAPSAPSPTQSVEQQPTTMNNAAFVKATWIPFMEVEQMLSSGDAAVAAAAIAVCMEDCAAKGVNTVYFHVRANSDAYYASSVFMPDPACAALLEQGFDPLACAIAEAHARSIELHAWINPYRIGNDASFAKTEDYFEYGGKYYYDPASATAQALVLDGVRELVERYGIDGVQFDDYFYPSGAVEASIPAAFEADDYAAYRDNGGALSVGDWRRWQVSSLVFAVRAACHERDGCVFGISPAYNIAANRENLYADVELWAKTAGYVDYLCPQLYFGFRHEYAPFMTLLEEWTALPRDGSVALYAGLAVYKTGMREDPYAGSGKTEWLSGGDILVRQAAAVHEASWNGIALYSHASFVTDDSRDAAVAAAECEAVCALWRQY